MQSNPSKNFVVIGFVLGLLFFCSFIGYIIAGYVSIHSVIYHVLQFVWIFFFGLYNLYTGIKKLSQRKAKQEQVHWYNQPTILLAIGAFLLLPIFLLEVVVSETILDRVSVPTTLLLFAPSVLFMLAAAFFAIRRLLGYQRSKV